MILKRMSVVVATAAALAVPALAVASKPDTHPGKGHAKQEARTPKGKAYGKYCQSFSKKHVKGEKGTPFSRCVKAMAKAVEDDAKPKKACKGLSKKHVKGEKGTPFSRCVVAAAKAKHAADDEDTGDEDGGPTGPTGPTGDAGAES